MKVRTKQYTFGPWSQAKTQVVFKSKTQAQMFSIESGPQRQEEVENRAKDGGRKAFILASIHASGGAEEEPVLVVQSQEGQTYDEGNGGRLYEVGRKEQISSEQSMVTGQSKNVEIAVMDTIIQNAKSMLRHCACTSQVNLAS